MLGFCNNWNIIKILHKEKSSEDFDKIHQVVLNSISDNMAATVKTGKYDTINTSDTATKSILCYKIIFKSLKTTIIHNLRRKNRYSWLTSCQRAVHELQERQPKLVLGKTTTIKRYNFYNTHNCTHMYVCNNSSRGKTNS